VRRPSWLSLYCSALYGFLYLPLLVMFVFSFNDARRNVVWKGFTLKWYGVLFQDAELMKAMLTSLELAAAAAAIASVIGLLAAYAMVRHRPFPALLNVPLMMP
jgi:ABC-type spermidine/putrescine transport system permease subunit II